MEEKIIAELNALLANSESSTAAILTKAIQLAEFSGEEEYRLLFTYHLKRNTRSRIVSR